MSEKRVNIKITASTSDFDKAIKKAQKQIKELTDTIADINKDKFGDELEKQFKNITESAEKAQEQLKDIKDSLDDIDKIKLDKLEKQIEEITDSTEKLNDNLKDTKDAVEDLNKANTDKLEDGFKDVNKAVEDTTNEVKDLNKEISSVDNTKVEKLTDSFKDMDTHIDNATDSMKKLNNETDDFGDNANINKFGDNIKDIKQDTDNLAESFNNINDNISNVDASGLKKIANMTDNIKDVFSGDNTLKFDTNGNSLLDTVVEGFMSGTVAGNKLSDAMEEVAQNINQITDSMKEMNEATTPQEIAKQYNDLINDLIKVQKEYDKTADRKAAVEEEYANKLFDRGMFSALAEEERQNYEAFKEASEEAEEQLAYYKEQLNKLNNIIDEYNQRVDDWSNKNAVVTQGLEEQRKVVDDLRKEYENAADGLGGFDKTLADLNDRVHDLGKSFDDMSFDSKLAKGLSDELKNMDLDSFSDGIYKLSDAGDTLGDVFEKVVDNTDELNRRLEKLGTTVNLDQGVKQLIDEFNELYSTLGKDAPDDIVQQLYDVANELERISTIGENDPFDRYTDGANKLAQKMKQGLELALKLEDVARELDNITHDNSSAFHEEDAFIQSIGFDEFYSRLEAVTELIERLSKEREKLNTLEQGKAVLDNQGKELEETYRVIKDLQEELGDTSEAQDEMMESLQRTSDEAKKAYENYKDFLNSVDSAEESLNRLDDRLEELEEDMVALNEVLAKGDKIAEESADAFNKKLKAYEALSQKVKAYLEDESNAMVLREKVAKSFRQVSEAMEKVYSGSSKFNNADLIEKTLEDAKKYIKELDVISTENIQADLERLGKMIDDKTEKIKRFKEANKEFGTEAGNAAYGLEKQAESLKEYADSTAFVIEATNTLKKAWGDISIGDEDHLKIRAREELLDGYVEKLKKAAYGIKKHYSETFGPITAKEQDKLNDWEIWEKNAKKLKEYNRAIEEYFTTLLDNKGKIDDKFLTDGKFDVDKFIKDFEKMGTSTMVLSKQMNAVKTELLENIKAQKEAAQHAVENAKAAKEQAEAAVKAAKTAEEEAEAKERLVKAEQELKEAKEKSHKVDKERIDDADKLIKKFNEQAEALRKLGIAVEDINKADISKFDKSLGSILDRKGTFGDDIAKTFGDIKEDIMAVFESFNSFDLGDIADGLKDVFSGIFSKIPTEVKLVVAAITTLIVALDKLYESGKRQFFEGLEKGWSFITKIGDIARDVGQEVKDAFEDITGIQLDWSSLMALGPEFEYQMEKVGAIAGSNEKQLEELIKKAKKLGGETQFKASEVGEAFEYMAKHTWSVMEKSIA